MNGFKIKTRIKIRSLRTKEPKQYWNYINNLSKK